MAEMLRSIFTIRIRPKRAGLPTRGSPKIQEAGHVQNHKQLFVEPEDAGGDRFPVRVERVEGAASNEVPETLITSPTSSTCRLNDSPRSRRPTFMPSVSRSRIRTAPTAAAS